MFTGFYTTDKGHQYIAKAVAGSSLVMTSGQFGNGMLPEGTDVASLTELVAPLGNLPIIKQKIVNNCVITTTQFTNLVNGGLMEPFHFMEAGLFGKVQNADGTDDEDAPETLLFYAYEPSTETADYISATLTEFFINWPLTISESANVTVKIDEGLIFPTVKQLYENTPRKVTAEGTGDEIVVTVDNVSLKDGTQLLVNLTNDLTENATLQYNGEEYPIYNANGTPVTEGQQLAGSTLNVVFNEEQKCWYIVGGGSVEVATAEEAKAGTDNTKMMTPLRVKNYVDEILGDINTILDSINGEVI